MIERQTISNTEVIECLKRTYGIEVLHLNLLPLGSDQNALIFKAFGSSNVPYFVKIKYNHKFDVSISLIVLLKKFGILHIISPIKTINGQSSYEIKGYSLIVYPFIDGTNGFERELTEDQWFKFGKTLRQLHETEVPTSIQNQVRRETFSGEWRRIVRELLLKMDSSIQIRDEVAFNLLNYVKSNLPIIVKLMEYAERLANRLKNQPHKFVLCHSDIHAGNVLIDNMDSIYIVDWDHPIMAPKERDLMFIGSGVGIVWNKSIEEKHFYNGYGHVQINYEMLAYYRFERIVEDIALFGQSILLTMDGGDQRPVMYKHFTDMFEPMSVIDIAFKTNQLLSSS